MNWCSLWGNKGGKQDQTHLMLSLPQFSMIYCSVLSDSGDGEREQQLQELWIVTEIITCRDKCIRQLIRKYYGAVTSDPPLTFNQLFLGYRNELHKTIKRPILINHLEADIFDEGSITLCVFVAKLTAKKYSIWVAKAKDEKLLDAHELMIIL